MQIVHHPNWYRDFLEDMARRGPTHLRDASRHCPIDNTLIVLHTSWEIKVLSNLEIRLMNLKVSFT